MRFSEEARRAQILFSMADAALTALAFEAAYATRSWIQVLPHAFFIPRSDKLLLLFFWILAWLCSGQWLGIHTKPAQRGAAGIVRDTSAQAAYAAIALVIFEYALRLDISRFFLFFIALFSWTLVLVARKLQRRG